MLAFLYTILRFFKALVRSAKEPQTQGLVISGGVLILIGSVFYSTVEGWSFLDAFYFSVTTLTTTGFGDLAPKTNEGKLFTVFYLLIGVGVFVGLLSVIAQQSGRKKR